MKESINQYIFGNQERIFLNTNLGCSSQCSYCYLPDLDIDINTKITKKIDLNKLIKNLREHIDFEIGKNGTIISIGCYSECWDIHNIHDTIKLLTQVIPMGNPIQLATKCEIKLADIEPILENLLWGQQLSIYISSSTISHWQKYENKTTNPIKRFKSFDITSKYNIPMYLYIKPMLPNITIKDSSQYIAIIKEYNINVILGEIFTTKKSDKKNAPIGNYKLFYDAKYNINTKEYQLLYNTLNKYSTVFSKSIEPILTYRSNHNG